MLQTPNARPWLVPGGGLLVVIAMLCGLGAWQLERAEEKRRLFDTFAASEDMRAAEAPVGDGVLAGHRYLRVELTGEFLPSRQILLDAMTHEGRVGYHVLTPLRPRGSSTWIMVNRGWVSAQPGRLPQIGVDATTRTLRGRIDALPRPGLQLAPSESSRSAPWPRVLLYPTMEELENVVDAPLAAYQLLLDAAEADGFVREWRPRTLSPQRHVGYAVQWFGLAAALLAASTVFLLREARTRRAAPATPARTTGAPAAAKADATSPDR